MEGSRMFFPALCDMWQPWATEHSDRKDQQGRVGSQLHRLQSHRPGTHSLGSPQDKCPRPWCQSSDLEGVCGSPPAMWAWGWERRAGEKGPAHQRLQVRCCRGVSSRLSKVVIIVGIGKSNSSHRRLWAPMPQVLRSPVRAREAGTLSPPGRNAAGAPGEHASGRPVRKEELPANGPVGSSLQRPTESGKKRQVCGE